MKRLYLETNFIVGQAFAQDAQAEKIIQLARAVGTEVCIPSICTLEALSTVEARGKNTRQFSRTLRDKLNELRADQSVTARALVASLNQALVENGRLVNERQTRMAMVFESLLSVRFVHVDPQAAHQAVSSPTIEDGAADNLILHAIVADASADPVSNMVFFTLNVHDFGESAPMATLLQAKIQPVFDSTTVLAWLNIP